MAPIKFWRILKRIFFQLNIFAQYYADYLAKKDNPTLIHSRTPYGENLYYYMGPVDGYKAVDVWYNEHKLYNFNLPDPPNYVQVGKEFYLFST